ncbi:MAG: glycolate oxidase subunit GlcE [Caulobacterales bacterium]
MLTSRDSEAQARADAVFALAEQVRRASEQRRPLRIVGGGTKGFYGRPVDGEPLSLGGHSGIVHHDPSELVVVARAGTPVAEIEAALADHGQMLGFEPPLFGPGATIGGVVAAGLAGPRRPFVGAVRDLLLGATVLNGHGEVLRFGGQVFKNVAGFDGFRLMAGAQGCLGVILEVSLRVTPKPRRERALSLEVASEPARAWVSERLRRQSPLSAAFYDGERLHLRLSGGEAAVEAASADWGGEAEDLAFWDEVRHCRHPMFRTEGPLWRVSVPQTAPELDAGDLLAWDWGGAQRWYCGDRGPDQVRAAASAAGGHATLFRGSCADGLVFQPLSAPILALHQRLKAAFDPAGVFNPGRMYPEL